MKKIKLNHKLIVPMIIHLVISSLVFLAMNAIFFKEPPVKDKTNAELQIKFNSPIPEMHHCIIIGRDKLGATTDMVGAYNVVIADTITHEMIGAQPHNYLFIVDYNCEFLKDEPELKGYLKGIEDFVIPQEGGEESIRIAREDVILKLSHKITQIINRK